MATPLLLNSLSIPPPVPSVKEFWGVKCHLYDITCQIGQFLSNLAGLTNKTKTVLFVIIDSLDHLCYTQGMYEKLEHLFSYKPVKRLVFCVFQKSDGRASIYALPCMCPKLQASLTPCLIPA